MYTPIYHKYLLQSPLQITPRATQEPPEDPLDMVSRPAPHRTAQHHTAPHRTARHKPPSALLNMSHLVERLHPGKHVPTVRQKIGGQWANRKTHRKTSSSD